VTSVHQTTAGKMIFGRYDERGAAAAVGVAADARSAESGQERPPRPYYPEPGR
jgi:hypothetical protein